MTKIHFTARFIVTFRRNTVIHSTVVWVNTTWPIHVAIKEKDNTCECRGAQTWLLKSPPNGWMPLRGAIAGC